MSILFCTCALENTAGQQYGTAKASIFDNPVKRYAVKTLLKGAAVWTLCSTATSKDVTVGKGCLNKQIECDGVLPSK